MAFTPELVGPVEASRFFWGGLLSGLASVGAMEWLSQHRAGQRARNLLKQGLLASMRQHQAALLRHDEAQRKRLATWLHGRAQALCLAARAQVLAAAAGPAEAAPAQWAAAIAKLEVVAGEGGEPLAWKGDGALLALPGRLRQLGQAFEGLIQVDCLVEEGFEALPLEGDPAVLDAVLQLAEEALLNACKHAASPRAVVRLGRLGEAQGSLAVQDFGRGLMGGPGPEPLGLGLGVLAPWLEAQGGGWQLHGQPGEGTTFSLRFPLRPLLRAEAA